MKYNSTHLVFTQLQNGQKNKQKKHTSHIGFRVTQKQICNGSFSNSLKSA